MMRSCAAPQKDWLSAISHRSTWILSPTIELATMADAIRQWASKRLPKMICNFKTSGGLMCWTATPQTNESTHSEIIDDHFIARDAVRIVTLARGQSVSGIKK